MTMKLTAAAIVAAALTQSAFAADLSWASPTAITSAEQALFSVDQIQYAVSWGGTAQTVTLAGGETVDFTAGSIDGSGLIGVTGAFGMTGPYEAGYSGTSNSGFNAVLNGFAFDGTHTITLTGLTIGKSYSIQLFSIDNRDCCGPRWQTFGDQNGHVSNAYLHSDDAYVVGSFVADGTTQTLIGDAELLPFCSGYNPCTNLNAAVLRDTSPAPEPASWAMFIGGFGLVGGAMRRKRTSIRFV